MIEFTNKSPVINLTPNYRYAGITALFQLNDSILVVDSNANCIVHINRSDYRVTTHSGMCKVTVSAAIDGSFSEARYEYPNDLSAREGNYTHLYVLDDNSLRLINQLTESVETIFEGYWFSVFEESILSSRVLILVFLDLQCLQCPSVSFSSPIYF